MPVWIQYGRHSPFSLVVNLTSKWHQSDINLCWSLPWNYSWILKWHHDWTQPFLETTLKSRVSEELFLWLDILILQELSVSESFIFLWNYVPNFRPVHTTSGLAIWSQAGCICNCTLTLVTNNTLKLKRCVRLSYLSFLVICRCRLGPFNDIDISTGIP